MALDPVEAVEVEKEEKLIIRKCHKCGLVTESPVEQRKCLKCQKAFLPLNYFEKIHSKEQMKFYELFAQSQDLEEEDLVKGLFVIW